MRVALSVWIVMLAVVPFSSAAQQLQVQPLVVEFPPDASATFITIANESAAPVTFQVRAFGWAQTAAGETLSPGDALGFSPPFATIPGGSSQVIRLVLQPPRGPGETAYQLVLDDIPPPTPATGVHLQFRVKIPVFTESDRFAAAKIVWRLEPGAQGQATLVAANQGIKHLRIGMITLVLADGTRVPVRPNGSFYVLPGVERRWPVTAPAGALRPGAKIEVTATGEHGPPHATIIAGDP